MVGRGNETMTPEQTRLLAESFSKLENRLYDLGSLVYQKLFEIDPNSRRLFKGDMEEQKLKLARVFAEFIRVKTRSQHFLPVTKKGGEAVIPGVGSLGERHDANYGVGCKHYIYMREALLYAISTLLGKENNDEIGQAWAETFDMLPTRCRSMWAEGGGGVRQVFHRKIAQALRAGAVGLQLLRLNGKISSSICIISFASAGREARYHVGHAPPCVPLPMGEDTCSTAVILYFFSHGERVGGEGRDPSLLPPSARSLSQARSMENAGVKRVPRLERAGRSARLAQAAAAHLDEPS